MNRQRWRGRSQKKPKKLWLSMDVVYPNKEMGSDVATCLLRAKLGGRLVARKINFAHNGNCYEGNPVETDDQGLAAVDFKVVPGSHLFEAWDDETSLLISKRLQVPEPRPKVPGQLIVKPAGRDGDYFLAISVLEQGTGAGIKGREVWVDDSAAGTVRLKTGESGLASHRIKFREHRRLVCITVPGTCLEWRSWLYGPKEDPVSRAIRLIEGS